MFRTNRKSEGGFALLMVFVMAATIGIFLYTQMPRVAFESQRAKEDLLIQRGEQYKRAIQVFVRKNNRYPATLEELEGLNGVRYLRRRYKDPMTGKEEWRLVHVGPGGVLTDSVVSKQKGPLDKEEKKAAPSSISEGPAMTGLIDPTTAQPTNIATRVRASDRPGAPGTATPAGGSYAPPGAPPADGSAMQQPAMWQPPAPFNPNAQPGQTTPLDPNAQPGQAGQPTPNVQPGQPGQFNPYQQQPGQSGQPNPFQQSGQPASPYPQTPGIPGVSVGRFQPNLGNAPSGAPTPSVGGGMMPGSGYQTPGTQPMPSTTPAAGGVNPGLDIIQKLLTTPRAGGLPGSTAGTGQTIGGGIAGVASKLEGDSIKIYRERQKYNEWEFIYDIKEDLQKMVPGGQGQTQDLNRNPLGTPPPTRSTSGPR